LNLSLILGATATCFALRALPRIGKPLIGHDTWAILLVVDELRKGHGYNGVCKYFLIKGDHDYPPLFFYFLLPLPSSWLRKYNWAINPTLDSMNCALLFGTTYLLSQSSLAAFIAAMIYSFTPVVLEESLNLNARIFGLIVFNFTLVSLMIYYYSGGLVSLIAAISFGIIVLLSHKFATQVFYLLMISFAVLLPSYIPLALLCAVVIGAIAFSRSFYLRILRGHVGITRFWLKHHKEYGSDYLGRLYSCHATNDRGNKEETTNDPRLSVRGLWQRTKWANPLYWLLKINPFNPFALIPIIMLLFVPFQLLWQRMILDWSILTFIFFYLATYLPFLAQPMSNRQFLDYNAFPTAYLCAMFVLEWPSSLKLLAISLMLLLSLVQNVRAWSRVRLHSRSDDQSILRNTFTYLRSSNKEGVLCLPSSHTYAIPYFSGKKVFYTVSARNCEKLASFIPVLTVPVKKLVDEYSIDFVLVDTTIVPVNRIDLSGFRQVVEENSYALYERFK